MRPVLAVLTRTESFARLWEDLAGSAGAELRTGETVDSLSPLADVCGVIIAVAGEEEAAGDALRELAAAGQGAAVVVGAAEDRRIAVASVRAGAADYFALPADLEELQSWASGSVDRAAQAERAGELAVYERGQHDFSRIIGQSPDLRAALERASRIIPRSSATVLVTGETGTGKELIAQAIHYNGPRAAGPFVEINCTALPATLLEAELFGYEKGAFTDARAPKPGLFEAAHTGTLFLDEIGDLVPELQAKLLRVLEERSVRRLGSLRTTQIDVRIIAATHVDLADAVREGRMREDLYYRLNVVPIHLPPLRDRGDDVILLADAFLDQASAEHELPRPSLTPTLRSALRAHPWPGNVRELRNAIERAVLLGDGELRASDLFLDTPASLASRRGSDALPFPARMQTIEEAAARAMVDHCEGNKSAAADALGISRSRLYRLLGEAGTV